VVLEHRKNFFSFCSREKRNFTAMPSRRRDRKTLDSEEEREIQRRRGRHIPELLGAREMHELCARLDAM
jgi:hypothetical protein